MTKYFTLCTLHDNGHWYPQFGDYNRDVVLAECDEYSQPTTIVSSRDTQDAIDARVARLNRRIVK